MDTPVPQFDQSVLKVAADADIEAARLSDLDIASRRAATAIQDDQHAPLAGMVVNVPNCEGRSVGQDRARARDDGVGPAP